MSTIRIAEFSGITCIYTGAGEAETEIVIFHPEKAPGQNRPAKINCPATGSQTVENTKVFIEGLKKAVEIAQELNVKQKTKW